MIAEMNMTIQALSRGECPLCKVRVKGNLGEHLKKAHGNEEFKKIAKEISRFMPTNSFFVINTKDIRINRFVYPMGVKLLEEMSINNDFNIKEIVAVTLDNGGNFIKTTSNGHYLKIVHRYLLIFMRRKRGN